MFKTLKRDLKFIKENDPAARNTLEIFLTYPGLHVLWGYRLSHKLWKSGFKLLARWISFWFRFLTGIEIHPAAVIKNRIFIDHGMGVVIGETAEIHDNVIIYQGATLGATSLEKGKRHPTIEKGTVIGAGAKILGPITIGAYSRIGANAVVLKSTPESAIVVGVPGQIILSHSTKRTEMPDTIGETLASAIKRLDKIENELKITSKERFFQKNGIWSEEDFSI